MLPRVVIHSQTSVDGRITTRRGVHPLWQAHVRILQSRPLLYYELYQELLGDGLHADMNGAESILLNIEAAVEAPPPSSEEPSVQERSRPDFAGAKVQLVPDSRGRIRWPPWIKHDRYSGDLVVLCSNTTPRSYLAYLKEEDIDYIVAGKDHVDLRAALEEARLRYDVPTVICQGGGALNGALLRAGVVSEVSVLMCPIVIGGVGTPTLFDAPELASVEGITRLKLFHFEQFEGGTFWFRYEVVG